MTPHAPPLPSSHLVRQIVLRDIAPASLLRPPVSASAVVAVAVRPADGHGHARVVPPPPLGGRRGTVRSVASVASAGGAALPGDGPDAGPARLGVRSACAHVRVGSEMCRSVPDGSPLFQLKSLESGPRPSPSSTTSSRARLRVDKIWFSDHLLEYIELEPHAYYNTIARTAVGNRKQPYERVVPAVALSDLQI